MTRWKLLPDNLKDRIVKPEVAAVDNIPHEGGYIFDIDPQPAPRMNRSDRWAKRPIVMRHFAWRNELKSLADKQHYELTDELDITFIIPMPDSWSEKKKVLFDGKPHKHRPDIDNITKSFFDTLSKEDGFVYKLHAVKFWGRKGKIIITEKVV